jgi:hypothetical protein
VGHALLGMNDMIMLKLTIELSKDMKEWQTFLSMMSLWFLGQLNNYLVKYNEI